MNNAIWKLFCQTGNIESYLLLKELENDTPLENVVHQAQENSQSVEYENEL